MTSSPPRPITALAATSATTKRNALEHLLQFVRSDPAKLIYKTLDDLTEVDIS
jgi:hypothetical protein